jgi:hypothetical protein
MNDERCLVRVVPSGPVMVQGPVRIDDAGRLQLRPLAAEIVAPEVLATKDAVLARLPMLPLARRSSRGTASPGSATG